MPQLLLMPRFPPLSRVPFLTVMDGNGAYNKVCLTLVAAGFAPWRVRPHIDSDSDQMLKIYISLIKEKISQILRAQ